MKRLVRSVESKIVVEIVVDEFIEDVRIDSAIDPVQPSYPVDYSIDEQALADYNSFIEDSKEELENLDLEILESNSSKRSLTSKYFVIADLTQDVEYTMKYMIFLRIFDHYEATWEDKEQLKINQGIRNHQDLTKAKYSEKQGHKVIWKVRHIIVNGDIFASYESALARVRELAAEWSELLQANPYFDK